MKKITRRLYTKPVILSLSILVGMVLLVGLFVTAKSRAATTFIPAGDDEFETTNNGETYHNFSATPIPANFFGPGSQAYSGLVPLEGVPLGPGSDVDTVIHRNQDVYTPGTTSLTMTGLSLKSINPIKVTYSGGAQEDWNVEVRLSTLKASTGSMTISSNGTFDSSLNVYPKFTFIRVSDGARKEIDTGGPNGGLAATSESAAQDDVFISPEPQPTIAPCHDVADEFEEHVETSGDTTFSARASSGSCAPVTLTSNNSPWQICPGGSFCIPRPITEQELLASHFASPKGTKKKIASQTIGNAE